MGRIRSAEGAQRRCHAYFEGNAEKPARARAGGAIYKERTDNAARDILVFIGMRHEAVMMGSV